MKLAPRLARVRLAWDPRGVLPYISHIDMCHPKGYGFTLVPFKSENRHRFSLFWSGIGYGFRGNYSSVWMYLLFQFQMNQKERVIWKFETDFKKPFRSSSSLKIMTWFSYTRSENESGFEEPGGTPPPKIPRSTYNIPGSCSDLQNTVLTNIWRHGHFLTEIPLFIRGQK